MTGAEIIKPALGLLFFALFIVALVSLNEGIGPDVETWVRGWR